MKYFRGLGFVSAIALSAIIPFPAHASSLLHAINNDKILSVCHWPEYYSITYRNPRTGTLEGIDIDLARELARDLGVSVRHVPSSFPRFISDLLEKRCDIAMFGVGVTPDRARQVRFTQPYLQSGIVAIAPRASVTIRRWDDIDTAGVVVAVAPGTFMEGVMRNYLKRASVLAVQPPSTREQEVEAGRADVFMTDFPYSRRVLELEDWAKLVEPAVPLSPTSYAYAVAPGDDAWFERVEAFVAAIKKDGRLAAAGKRHNLTPILVRD